MILGRCGRIGCDRGLAYMRVCCIDSTRSRPTQQACERLLASYRAIPPNATVRLAKPTSNLFRARAKSDRQGPGHLGADGRHRRRPRGAHRRRRGHVHLRGPGRRDAAVRVVAAGGAAAEDDHPRRRGDRARHRVRVVPQRPAARVGAGDGHPHRHRRGRHRDPRPARRSLPRLPEFLWHAWLFGAAEDRAGAGQAVRRAAAPAVPRRWPTWSRRWTASSRPAATTACPSTTSTVWCSAPTRATCASASRPPTPGPVSDYTGQQIYYRSIQHARRREARPADHPRLPVALGHRLVLVLAGIRRAEPDASGGSGRGGYRRSSFYWKLIALRPAVRHRRPHREAQRPAAAGARGAGHRGADRAHRRVPRLVPGQRADRTDLAVPAAAARRRRAGRCTRSAGAPHLRQRRLLVVGAGGRHRGRRPTG